MKRSLSLTQPVVLMTCLALTGLATSACNEDEGESPPSSDAPAELVPDTNPLARMTAEQYRNTVRDLFPGIELSHIYFPVELEGRGGFENNEVLSTATPGLVEAYQTAATQVAGELVESFDQLLGCEVDAGSCGRDWVRDFAERAWRRPLSEAEQTTLLARYDDWFAQSGGAIATQLSIAYLLQSADFIYFPRFGTDAPAPGTDAVPLTDYELASRLSYFLWNSMPDQELLDLAASGQLTDRQVLADQAFRMLADWRAVEMVVSFHRQTWDFDDVGSSGIDLDFYAANFNALGLYAEDDKSDFYYLEYMPKARFESDVFVAQHVFYGDGRLETLLTSNQTWSTPEVASMVYEAPINDAAEPFLWGGLVPGEGNDEIGLRTEAYYPVELDPSKRAGLFTMVGFLIAKAGPQQPAPVRRGVTILDRLLCTELHPPGDVPPLEEVENQEPKTNRDKYALHVASEACAGCHRSIDGIGFTFENYDSMGRWRDQDNGYEVDASGELLTTDQDGPVANAVELMQKMGNSRTVHDCYTRQWFRYAFGRNESAADQPTLEALQEGFWASDGDILKLIVNIAGSYSFRHRSAQ